MKTTIELPDDLLAEAKVRAAEQRRPLRALIEAALRAELRSDRTREPKPEVEIEWVTAPGGLPPGLDVSDREAFGQWLVTERTRS